MENKGLDKVYIDVCKNLGWTVSSCCDGYVDLSQFSPAGEDFCFSVEVDDFVENVKSYAESFDTEEHVLMHMEAKRNGFGGVPSLRTLVDDADAISEMLDDLWIALEAEDKKRTEAEYMYERYKLAWMLDHGYTLKDLIDQLNELRQENIDGDLHSIFDDWEFGYGFGSEIWVGYDEFVNNELRFCKDAEVQND